MVQLVPTSISDLYVLERSVKGDSRGFLERLFCQKTLSEILLDRTIRQINYTFTAATGTIRGLHYQFPPYAEMKIVSCIKGEVFDVAVDLRKDSPTFLQHYSKVLSPKNCLSLVIPEGFAHGFQTLTNDCEMIYVHTADYQPTAEGALNALDPRLAIKWPKRVSHRSDRDTRHAMTQDSFLGLEL